MAPTLLGQQVTPQVYVTHISVQILNLADLTQCCSLQSALLFLIRTDHNIEIAILLIHCLLEVWLLKAGALQVKNGWLTKP